MFMNEQYQEQEQEQPMPGTVSMSSTTGITKPVTRKRGMHVNPQFVRTAKIINFDSEFVTRDTYENLWSTDGEIDCSQCKSLKTPCDATLFMLPRLTRLQLLKKCGRQGNRHFMDGWKYCLLCKIQNPQQKGCLYNIWDEDGDLNTWKEDGIIHLVTVIENRWKEMVVMGKISQEFVDVYKERWSEIFDDDFIYLIFFNVFKSFPCTVISNIIKQQFHICQFHNKKYPDKTCNLNNK